MSIGLIGTKIGMTRLFDETGISVGVTVIQAGPCPVAQVKTPERDSYSAVQLGYGSRKRPNRPTRGHFEKCGAEPTRALREFRVDDSSEYAVGDLIRIEDLFASGEYVDVSGVSKGRGFAGVVKRWGFAGQKASHGAEKNHRRPGSIGCSATPSRVVKGRKMPGRMGGERKTVQNLKVMQTDAENNLIVVKGAAPGPNGGFLLVRKAAKRSS